MSDAPRSDDPAPATGWRSLVEFWADIGNKLAIPLLTVLGTLLTLTINERNNTRATINQREQAESQLRSSMFSQLVNPLIDQSRSASDGDGDSKRGLTDEQKNAIAIARANRLALLAELLALNFHEHFELGPLLRYVEQLDGQTPQNKRTLRSVSRRVISRQLAMLGGTQTDGCRRNRVGVGTFEELKLVAEAGQPAKGQTCFLYEIAGPGKPQLQLECRSGGPVAGRTRHELRTASPDCRDELLISLSDLDWESLTLRVWINNTPVTVPLGGRGDRVMPKEVVDFTLSAYSLPFSDNTLLRSGNRFGLYVRQVEPDPSTCDDAGCTSSRRMMMLAFLWFPRDFFPPRERPTDFAEVRRALKLGGR